MSKYQLSILLVDDSEQEYATINNLLTSLNSWQCSLDQAPTYPLALQKMEQHRPDICLLNPSLSEREGFNSLEQLFKNDISTSLILLTKPGTSDIPLEVLEAGIVDYLVKGAFDAAALKRSIQHALRYKQLEGTLEKRVQERIGHLVAENKVLQEEVDRWKSQENMRRQKEQRYRELFDIDIYGVEVLDEQGHITECNNTYQRLLGYDHDEIVGQHTTAFVSESSKVRLNKKLSVVQKRGYAEGEIELVCKDGSTVLVWRRLRGLYNEAHQFTGTVAYSRDITERMKAVRQISTLARALEQSPLAILITDGEGTIEYINFRFTELTGYTYEEAVGQNLRFVKSVDQSPDTFRELWETISAGEEWQGEFYNLSRDGEAYWEYLTIAPMLSPQGTITHFIAVQDDITGRKEVETEARHTQQRVSGLMTEHIGDLTTANEQLQQEIAERKRIEQELRRNRARLKAQYKGIPLPTYSWQQSGDNLILVDYNDVAENESEGRIADFLGKTVNEVFKNDPQVLADFAHCITQQTTVRREAPYQLITTSEIKYYVTTYNYVPPELVVVHIQDITGQRQAEERLREYQAHPQDASEFKAELAKIKEVLLTEKTAHQAEVEKRRQIEIDFNHYRKQVERSPSEQIAELEQLKTVLEKETNKRQKLEKTLQESEDRFQQITGNIDDRLREQYRSIPVPTYTWQWIMGEFVLIDFNDAAAASMGKIVDFFGKTANEIFKDRPEVLADFERCYREKAKVVREAPYKMITTGETRYFVTTYNFAPPNLVIDHIQDITAQKEMEAELAKYHSQGMNHTANLTDLEARLQQEIKKREGAETALKQIKQQIKDHHDELEDVVQKRTFEVTEANKQLQREIFEHQRAEESLRDARARLKAQYKGIPIPTYSWRKVGDDFVLIDYNNAAEKSNPRIAQFISNPAREIFKDRALVLADFARCFNERKSIKREAPYRLITTGETRYFVTSYNFAPPNVITVYIQDITEHKQIEEYYHQSIEQLELKCRFSAQRTVTFVNEAYCWYFNVNQEEVIGQSFPFIVENDRKKFERHLASLNQNEPAGSIECQVQKSDGSIRWQRWINRAIFDKHGRLIEYRSTSRDITRRKETKE